MMSELLLSLFVLLLAVSVLLLTGSFIINIFGIQSKDKFFYPLFAGLVLWVVLYSLAKSGFKTVNLGFLIIGGWSWFLLRDKTSIKAPSIKVILYDMAAFWKVLVLPVLGFWGMQLLDFYNGKEFIAIDGDLIYYSKISALLKYLGKESHNPDLLYEDIVTPYHYFELWLNALISEVSGIISLKALKMVTIPLLQTLILTGFIDYLKKYNFNTFRITVLALSGFLFSGILPQFYENLPVLSDAGTFHISTFTLKLLVVFIFIQATVILLIDGKKELSFIVASMIPLVSIAAAPGVLGGSILFFSFQAIRRKKEDYGKFLFLFLSVAVFILLFYVLLSQNGPTDGLGGLRDLLFNSRFIKTARNIAIGGMIQLISLYLLPLLLLVGFGRIILQYISDQWQWSIWCGLVLLCSLVSWAILHFMINSVQLFSIPAIALINILFVSLFFQIFSTEAGWRKYAALVCLAAVAIYSLQEKFQKANQLMTIHQSRFDKEFHEKVAKEVKGKQLKGVFFSDVSKMKSIFDKHLNVYWPSDNYIPLYSDAVSLTAGSFTDIPVSADSYQAYIEKGLINAAPIKKYFDEHAGKDRARTIKEFIMVNKIDLIVFEKGVAYRSVIDSLPFKKIAEDKFTGDEVYLVRN